MKQTIHKTGALFVYLMKFPSKITLSDYLLIPRFKVRCYPCPRVAVTLALTLALNSPEKIYTLIHANQKIHINNAKYTIKCFLHIFT